MVPLFRRLTVVAAVALAVAMAPPLAAGSAWAQSLDEAKAAGFIGERPDGYVGVVRSDAPSWAANLADRINAERRARYEDIARKTGANPRDVGILAGQKLIASAPPGSFVLELHGQWVRK